MITERSRPRGGDRQLRVPDLAGLGYLGIDSRSERELQLFAHGLLRAIGEWQYVQKRREEGPFPTRQREDVR
jgi:hypothetical protein